MICSAGIKNTTNWNKKKLTREKHDKLNSSSAVTPSFYGLAKIHEEGNPIRPIVFSAHILFMKFLRYCQKLSPL